MPREFKEVWLVKGRVTNPGMWFDLGYVHAQRGDVEWQFSDGPPGQRGSSSDYLDLEEGLKAHSGAVIYYTGD